MFLECSVPNVDSEGFEKVNVPINISFCVSILKITSDDGFYSGFHAISFTGTNIEWIFASEEDRDAEYRLIMDLVSIKPPIVVCGIDKDESSGDPNYGKVKNIGSQIW